MQINIKRKDRPDCLWKQAQVVHKKECYKDFDCTQCRFDKAMNRVCFANQTRREQGLPVKEKQAGFVFWVDKLKKNPVSKRPCIHHMKGHIELKNCNKSYHCVDCEFDQYFYDQFKVHTVLKPMEFADISGVSLPVGYYLHPGHVWIKLEDNGMVRVGIDDFAARLLGKFEEIKTPLMGKKAIQDKPFFTLSRQGNDVAFQAPVNGIITEVNGSVRKNPGLINQSPYTDGWVFILYCPELKRDLKQLMFMNSSKEFMNKEVKRIYEILEEETQLKAADGGNLVSDIYGNLPHVSWEKLLEKFIPQGP